MTSDRTQLVNELHDSMQEIKRWYLQNPDRLSKTNQGLGAGQNSITTEILKRNDVYRPFQQCCADLDAYASDSNLSFRDRYSLVREMLVAHPTLHELWYFDGHYNHVTGNRDVGPRVRRMSLTGHRWGVGSYLTRRSGEGERDRTGQYLACAAKALEFTALLENLYAGHLDQSLFDVKPLGDDELPSAIAFLQAHPEPRYAEVVALMPKVFEVTRTILHQAGEDPAIAGSVINKIGDITWAMCAINEGPIFERRSERSGLDILRRLNVLDECAIRRTLSEHYDVVTDGYELVNRECVTESHSLGPVVSPAPVVFLSPAASPLPSAVPSPFERAFASLPAKGDFSRPGADLGKRIKFMERLSKTTPSLAHVGERVFEWADRNALCMQWGGTGMSTAIPFILEGVGTWYQIVHIRSNGKFLLDLQYVRDYPQFQDKDRKAELIMRLSRVGSLGFSRRDFERELQPQYSMELLSNPVTLDLFVGALDWFVETIRQNPVPEAADPRSI